jgi:hypothetical protein
MRQIFSDNGIARTVKVSESISLDGLDDTFEGALLYALISDDAPCALSEDEDRLFLGSNEFWGEGHLMFAGDLAGLRDFIDLAKTSQGRCAKLLLPVLENELTLALNDASSPCAIDMADIGDPPTGPSLSITLPEILQDLLIQHPEYCGDDHFTLTGHYALDTDPDHLGGYAFFITADDIKYQSTDEWLMTMRSEHRSKLAPRL